MQGIAIEDRLVAIERRARTQAVKSRRMDRVQVDHGAQLAELKRSLSRLHMTLIGGFFALAAATIGGVFDLLSHMHP